MGEAARHAELPEHILFSARERGTSRDRHSGLAPAHLLHPEADVCVHRTSAPDLEERDGGRAVLWVRPFREELQLSQS